MPGIGVMIWIQQWLEKKKKKRQKTPVLNDAPFSIVTDMVSFTDSSHSELSCYQIVLVQKLLITHLKTYLDACKISGKLVQVKLIVWKLHLLVNLGINELKKEFNRFLNYFSTGAKSLYSSTLQKSKSTKWNRSRPAASPLQ